MNDTTTTTQPKLTAPQLRALDFINAHQDVDGSIGSIATSTLRILEDRGLVTGEKRPGVPWRWIVLTDKGRQAVKA